MKTRIAIFCLLLVAVLGSRAFAVKSHHEVTQSSPGLQIHATEREDGRIRFTITRDPAQAHWNGEFDTRDFWVRSGDGDVECEVAGQKTKAGIEYSVILTRKAIPHTRLTLREIQGDGSKYKLVGGGDIFEISLAEIAISPAK